MFTQECINNYNAIIYTVSRLVNKMFTIKATFLGKYFHKKRLDTRSRQTSCSPLFYEGPDLTPRHGKFTNVTSVVLITVRGLVKRKARRMFAATRILNKSTKKMPLDTSIGERMYPVKLSE